MRHHCPPPGTGPAKGAHRAPPLRRGHPGRPALQESKRLGHNNRVDSPSFTQTWPSQERNAGGTHFISLGNGPWPNVPNQYIRRGARPERTHPNDDTTHVPPNGRAGSGAPPDGARGAEQGFNTRTHNTRQLVVCTDD